MSTAGDRERYTQDMHIASGVDGYTLHLHTAGGGKGCRHYNVHTIDCPHVHTAGSKDRYTLHSTLLTEQMDTLCMSKLLVVERDKPCASILLAVEK
jgi:hypothetical protein